jgi:hypothetical protein
MDDPFRRSELRHQARIRLGAQRDRVRVLRRRAIVVSLLAFVLLWGVVFAQLVSGNDPVLGATKTKAKVKTVASAPLENTEPNESREIEAAEAEAAELEAAEFEAAEAEAVEAELAAAAEEPEAVTTSPS